MSKKNRDSIAAKSRSVVGRKTVFTPIEGKGIGKNTTYWNRTRKARRAQARLDKQTWRNMSEEGKLTL